MQFNFTDLNEFNLTNVNEVILQLQDSSHTGTLCRMHLPFLANSFLQCNMFDTFIRSHGPLSFVSVRYDFPKLGIRAGMQKIL